MEIQKQRLCDYLEQEKLLFSAVPFSSCKIINQKYLPKIPEKSFVIMLVAAYPAASGKKFASFSVLKDYHLFFKDLGDKIGTYFEIEYSDRYMRIFADVSPINERDAACRAGLGVMGKNGLFISPLYGSFVFLGEIICSLTDEEIKKEGIDINNNEISFCKSCGKCISACPTGAVSTDRSGCISALTQKKGILTKEEEAAIIKSGYVWGCDKCASACPLSRGSSPEYNSFFTSSVRDFVSYEDIEKMSGDEYLQYPFSWRKKEVLKRNFLLFENNE